MMNKTDDKAVSSDNKATMPNNEQENPKPEAKSDAETQATPTETKPAEGNAAAKPDDPKPVESDDRPTLMLTNTGPMAAPPMTPAQNPPVVPAAPSMAMPGLSKPASTTDTPINPAPPSVPATPAAQPPVPPPIPAASTPTPATPAASQGALDTPIPAPSIPAAPPVPGAAAAASGDAPKRPKKAIEPTQAHVLVVEDNVPNFVLIARMLAYMGVQRCEWKTSGWQVVEFADTLPRIDLILMDIRLPYEDGFQALEKVRANQRLKDTLVVAVTAEASVDQMKRAQESGFDGFLSKPLDPDRFPEQIRRVLNGEPVWEIH